MSEFKQVSLGFAEFVGQLLNETFEATLEAQQHQLRRVAELEAALTLPDELFLHLHVDQDTVLEKEMAIAGAPIARQMLLHDSVPCLGLDRRLRSAVHHLSKPINQLWLRRIA